MYFCGLDVVLWATRYTDVPSQPLLLRVLSVLRVVYACSVGRLLGRFRRSVMWEKMNTVFLLPRQPVKTERLHKNDSIHISVTTIQFL